MSKQMRAVVLDKAEGKPGQVYHPVAVKEVPVPSPKEGEVLVKIDYAAFNHRDLFIRRSLYPGVTFPSILGSDAVGTVVEPSSSPLNGKRVLLHSAVGWLEDESGPDVPSQPFGILGGVKQTGGRGTFAEYVAISTDNVVPCPGHLSGADQLAAAAAFPLGGLTAYRATFTKGRVRKGQNVLITGIGGGVALQALQYAVAVGANVYVTSGDQGKIDKAVELGAKAGFNYKDEAWPKQLAAKLPKERPLLDVIIDSAMGPIISQTARLMKDGGIIVCYGGTSMKNLDFGMPSVLKNVELKGSTMGSLAEFKEAVSFIDKHQIVPVVHTVLPGLDKIEDGFQLMDKAGQFGKICVAIAGSSSSSSSKL